MKKEFKETNKFNPSTDMIFAQPEARRYLVVKKKHVKILQPKLPKGHKIMLPKVPLESKPFFDFDNIEWVKEEK